jgi:Mn2+/Fe2+ NRAMP family transporter
LACGISSSITGTYAGQYIMQVALLGLLKMHRGSVFVLASNHR